MIAPIKNAISFSVICFTVMTFLACGGGEDETRKIGDGPESGGEGENVGKTDYETWRGRVLVSEMNFRTEPSADAPSVKGHETVYWGAEFDVLSEEGDWVRVRLDDGTEGWVRREYEGTIYVDETYYGNRPVGSLEFLAYADEEAGGWAPDAHLTFLCGSDGSLNGKCHEWIAFYSSVDKPGKKLACLYEESDSGKNGFRSEYWDEDWLGLGITSEERAEKAPGPIWWRYYPGYSVKGGDFIGTQKLLSQGNVERIVSISKTEIAEGLAAVARDYCGFVFVITEGKWFVILPKVYDGEYVFVFGAADGHFIEFRDETSEY